jgi:hypothetical protein
MDTYRGLLRAMLCQCRIIYARDYPGRTTNVGALIHIRNGRVLRRRIVLEGRISSESYMMLTSGVNEFWYSIVRWTGGPCVAAEHDEQEQPWMASLPSNSVRFCHCPVGSVPSDMEGMRL